MLAGRRRHRRSSPFPFRGTWWGGWILAIAEAGIVGGLADWFAVTAIFRRPLGLPIPHTALIPANWELMAARVGTMVGDRVLTKQYRGGRDRARSTSATLIARAAARLTRGDLEPRPARVARWLADQLPPQAVGTICSSAAAAAPARRPWAPTLAAALEIARARGWDQRLVDVGLPRALAEALERPAFRAAVGELVDDLLQRYRESMGGYSALLARASPICSA